MGEGNMSLADYAAMRDLENSERHCNRHYGVLAPLWVIVAVIIILAIVYNWTKNCNEKVQFATGLSRLEGRIACIEPDIRWAGQQLYHANGTIQSIDRGVRDMAQSYGDQLFQLNRATFYDDNCGCGCGNGRGRNNCGCGCGNREFAQTQNYTLASQGVTVTERCRN